MKVFRLAAVTLALGAMVGCSNNAGGTGGSGGGGASGGGAGGGGGGGSDGGTDGGTGGDGGLPACDATFAGGCATPIDLTAGGAAVSFDFPTAYLAPKCIKVTSTQAVSFLRVGTLHAIAPQDCGPENVFPVPLTAPATRTFSTVGTYGIHCSTHGTAAGTIMAVAIQVVP